MKSDNSPKFQSSPAFLKKVRKHNCTEQVFHPPDRILGLEKSEIAKKLSTYKSADIDVRDGKMFGYCYDVEDKQHFEFLNEVFKTWSNTNALNPSVYPSLVRFENEIVQMTISMLHGDDSACGSFTTGGKFRHSNFIKLDPRV